MMAWQAGGVVLPHFTGDQWADTYHISGSQLEPGDLVFSNGFGHVQMYVGRSEVIQAPHTGEVVSYAPLPPPVQVDGYASVFPPGHLAPAGRHVGRPGTTIGLADTGEAASVAGTTQPAGMAGHRPITTGITGHGLTINRGCEHHRACGHHRAGGHHRIRRHHPGTGRRSPAAHGISRLRGKAGDLEGRAVGVLQARTSAYVDAKALVLRPGCPHAGRSPEFSPVRPERRPECARAAPALSPGHLRGCATGSDQQCEGAEIMNAADVADAGSVAR
jgi:NlpC/P60 family